MAATSLGDQKPRPRTDSFQKMLDLEKKYKLARLHSTQTSPALEPAHSFQPQTRPLPIQTRRRNSLEALASGSGKANAKPVRQASQVPLSIHIPSPEERMSKRSRKRNEASVVVASSSSSSSTEDRLPQPEDDGESTPRVVPRDIAPQLDSRGDEDANSILEDSQSDQSSICQSPSWEGYGQQKKNKKMKAKQRKNDKEQAGPDNNSFAHKKRITNRLSKPPPQDFSKQRPSSSSAVLQGHGVRMGSRQNSSRSSLFNQKSDDLEASISRDSGTKSQLPTFRFSSRHPPVSASTAQQPRAFRIYNPPVHSQTTTPQGAPETPAAPAETTSSRAHMPLSTTRGLPSSFSTTAINEKSSYPPLSSRDHIPMTSASTGHSRRNSASTVASIKPDDMSNLFRPRHSKRQEESYQDHERQDTGPFINGNLSEQVLHSRKWTNEQDREGSTANTKSYVGRVRAQSIERSITGFLEQTVLSFSNNQTSHSPPPLEQPHATQALQAQVDRQQPPRASLEKHASVWGALGKGKEKEDAARNGNVQFSYQGRSSIQQERAQTMPLDPDRPTTSVRASNVERGGHMADDYVNYMTQAHSPPIADMATPTSGVFSSLKSRISRRSSSSSGSAPGATRSFRDKARSAMHLPPASVASGHKHVRRMTSGESQMTVSCTSQLTMEGATTHARREAPTVPLKAASRGLGEGNSEPMSSQTAQASSRPSEVSSSSSYHDDSSVPPSPASTPDTSRPQSTKELPATMEDVRLSNSIPAVQDKISPSMPSMMPMPMEVEIKADRKGDDSRPRSQSRLFEIVERPGSSGRFLETVSGKPASEDMEAVTQSSDYHTDLTSGLGILDASWGTMPHPTSDADASSFVTILSNQEAAESESREGEVDLKAQPSRPGSSDKHEDLAASAVHGNDPYLQHSADQQLRPRNGGGFRKKEKRANVYAKHMSMVKEEPKHCEDAHDGSHDGSHDSTSNEMWQAPGLADMRPASTEHHKQANAVYLNDARRSAPLVTSPLSNVIRSAKASMSSPSLLAPPKVDMHSSTKTKEPAESPFTGQRASRPPVPIPRPAETSCSVMAAPRLRVPAHEPEAMSKPLAKMLVQCCHCRFFHDMPSRVYECMAQPDAVVTDRSLGISGAITTMVKCPWCAHNMSRRCCAGYAAVVYLKERLH